MTHGLSSSSHISWCRSSIEVTAANTATIACGPVSHCHARRRDAADRNSPESMQICLAHLQVPGRSPEARCTYASGNSFMNNSRCGNESGAGTCRRRVRAFLFDTAIRRTGGKRPERQEEPSATASRCQRAQEAACREGPNMEARHDIGVCDALDCHVLAGLTLKGT